MILTKLKAYGFMALSVFLASLLGLQTWRLHTAQLETAEAVVTLSNERALSSAALANAQAAVRSTEAGLQASASQTRKILNDQVRTLGVQRDALLKRVRIAEANAATAALVSRVTAVASDRQTAPGGDGAELLASFGAEDVQEAHRADTLRLHLKACYQDYDRAEAALRVLNQ